MRICPRCKAKSDAKQGTRESKKTVSVKCVRCGYEWGEVR
jgi:Zn ribbon nucleic-acid-binding protein